MNKILYIPTFNKETEFDSFIKEQHPSFIKETNPDIILVSGGDGSLLHAIQDFSYMNIPFFGIANGTVNFLMNKIHGFYFEDFLKKLNSFDFLTASKIKISIKRMRSNETYYKVFETEAINDIVLGNGIMDFHSFNIKENLTEFDLSGLGILISTAVGSTAFNYNNNGPVLKLNSNEIIFSSLISEKEKQFQKILEPRNISIKLKSSRQKCFVFIDGQSNVFELKRNDIVEISKGSNIELGFIDKNILFEKRDKLIIGE